MMIWSTRPMALATLVSWRMLRFAIAVVMVLVVVAVVVVLVVAFVSAAAICAVLSATIR